MALSERLRLRQLIQRAGVSMLVTNDHGTHSGRPMLPLLLEDDPHIYFLTRRGTRKVREITVQPQIALTIIAEGCYVVVIGRAVVLRNPQLIDQLWHPTYRAWFAEGKSDPEATVIRVVVERVDYWEPPRSRVVRVFQAIKAVISRRAVETPMRTIDPW
jgi:general stress protein 26